jgi:hypothetical protein
LVIASPQFAVPLPPERLGVGLVAEVPAPEVNGGGCGGGGRERSPRLGGAHLGGVSRVRPTLAHYPKNCWTVLRKLATEIGLAM